MPEALVYFKYSVLRRELGLVSDLHFHWPSSNLVTPHSIPVDFNPLTRLPTHLVYVCELSKSFSHCNTVHVHVKMKFQ